MRFVQKRLQEEPEVDFAGYDVPHPLVSSPIVYVRMKNGRKPEEALLSAVEKVRQNNDAFCKELSSSCRLSLFYFVLP